MAASDTPGNASPPTPPLRVRATVPSEHRAGAQWALEALMARARVRDWQLVPDDADTDLDLPADPAQWRFTVDPPDADRDPLAATFWWLARVEELLAGDEAFDEHGRFTAAASAIVRGGDPLATPVDDLAASLVARVERWRVPLAPDEPAWRVVLTHDIDLPWRWTRSGRRRALRGVRDSLRAGRFGAAARTTCALVAGALGRRDPWDNLDRIVRLERELDATSTSYLLVGAHDPADGDAQLHELGAGYARGIADGRVETEVGLHGSYTTSAVPGRLAAERELVEQRVGRPVREHRFHYLRHRPVRDWPLVAAAGLTSDASLGFAEQPGFRAGTAHPFRAWDHQRGCPLDLVVIPFAVMDSTFDARYLPQGRRERLGTIRRTLARVRDVGGAATLLLHNDRLCNVDDDGWTRQYRTVLAAIREHGGRACAAGEAAAAYRALLHDDGVAQGRASAT
jgi:hypothetical protein